MRTGLVQREKGHTLSRRRQSSACRILSGHDPMITNSRSLATAIRDCVLSKCTCPHELMIIPASTEPRHRTIEHVIIALLAVALLSFLPYTALAAFMTFESGHVRPLALSPDGTRLFAYLKSTCSVCSSIFHFRFWTRWRLKRWPPW